MARDREKKARYLSLEHAELAFLDVHMVLDFRELGIQAVLLRHSIGGLLSFALNGGILLLQPAANFIQL